MGMFDYISIVGKLPVSKAMIKEGFGENNLVYQTKSLHKLMDKYIIQRGRLFKEVYDAKWVDDKTSPIGRRMERENERLELVKGYHGTINFYTLLYKDNNSFWIEYTAVFTKGKMTSLKLIKFEKKDETERNKQLKEVLDKADAESKLWYNKYIFYTRPYRKLRGWLYNGLTWLERGIIKLKLWL